MFNPETIQSALKPVFYFTKLLGLSPFKIGDGRYENSWYNPIWSLFLVSIFGGFLFFSVNSRVHHSAIITKITNGLHLHLSMISLCGGIFFGCLFRRNIIGVINCMSEMDNKLKGLDLKIDLKKVYRTSTIYTTSVLAVTIFCVLGISVIDILIFGTSSTVTGIGELLAYNSPMFTIFMQIQFCSLALMLKQRFRWLNIKMAEIGKCVSSSLNSRKSMKSHKNNNAQMKLHRKFQNKALIVMQDISVKHFELCEICKKLNSAYQCQILLLVVQGFMSIIAISFYLAKYTFSKHRHHNGLNMRLYYGPTVTFYILSLVFLSVICSTTAKEARKMGIYLHRVMSMYMSMNDGFLDLGVTCFSLQLLHQNVTFTACRLFVIDETMLGSIVGAATTYLVIVLQFEIGVSSGNSNGSSVNVTLN